jgi:hypothetical protein
VKSVTTISKHPYRLSIDLGHAALNSSGWEASPGALNLKEAARGRGAAAPD